MTFVKKSEQQLYINTPKHTENHCGRYYKRKGRAKLQYKKQDVEYEENR